MSEMTRCNYCSWEHYKKKYGKRVKLDHNWKPDSLDASFPLGVSVILDGKERISWFMELGKHCVC